MGHNAVLLNQINDLQVDDVDDGELIDGDDNKRINGNIKVEVRKSITIGVRNVNRKQPENAPKENRQFKKLVQLLKPMEKHSDIKIEDVQHVDDSATQPVDKKPSLMLNREQSVVKKPVVEATPEKTVPRSPNDRFTLREIDHELAKKLRLLVFGDLTQTFNDEWKSEEIKFSNVAQIKYALVKTRPFPSGLLAALQAFILLELSSNFDKTGKNLTDSIFNVGKKERSIALARSMCKMITSCSTSNTFILALPSSKAKFAPIGSYKSDGVTETLNLLEFDNAKQFETYLVNNVDLFENNSQNSPCICLLYSVILTRGIQNVQKDMDRPSNNLLVWHGKCSNELMNLLLSGRASSNFFNDSFIDDDDDNVERKGPNKRNDIGILSIYELKRKYQVGSYLKTPKYPVWVIVLESHFSVLFSLKKDLVNDWKAESVFDLFYYDSLDEQHEQARLTISCKGYDPKSVRKNSDGETWGIESVLHTKWKDASIQCN